MKKSISKSKSVPSKRAATPRNLRASASVGHFDGAVTNTDARGYLYLPGLNPVKEVDHFSRVQIAKKAVWFYNNNGLARRILRSVAYLIVGEGLWPIPTTKDTDWNRDAKAYILERAKSAQTWDISGRWNWYRAQFNKVLNSLKVGDFFTAFTSSASGQAQFAYYDGSQIDNLRMPPAGFLQDEWIDGCRLGPHGRIISYRVINQNSAGYTDITADNMRQFADLERVGQIRGMSALQHAVNNLHDLVEIKSYLKKGIKVANDMGYYITSQSGKSGYGPTEKGTADDGEVKQTLEKITGKGGSIIRVNGDIKTLMDSRPSPNTMAFMTDLAADIAMGVDLSPDLILDVARLGSAATRFTISSTDKFVRTKQDHLIESDLDPEYVYTIAKAIKSGALRPCKDPLWWAHDWQRGERISIDKIKDAKLIMDSVARGQMAYDYAAGLMGFEGEEMARLSVENAKRNRQMAIDAGLDPDRIFPPMSGTTYVPDPAAQPPQNNPPE